MNNPENNKWLDKILGKTIGSENIKPDFERWKEKHPHAVQTLTSRVNDIHVSKRPIKIKEIIMKNSITKLAAAAIILIAVALSLNFWERTASITYGIEQTIQANNNIRYLHFKNFKAGMEQAKEFWLEFDEQDNLINIRVFMPEWDSPTDGAKITVWQQGIAKVWFLKKNSLITINDESFSENLMKAMQLLNPKSVMLDFLNLEEQGLVKLEINEPLEKNKPITITSTNSTKVKEMGYDVDRTVISIDQSTKLATRIEHYNIVEHRDYELSEWTEFSEYNQQIDQKMFILNDEVPPEVNRIDWTTEEIGLAQGDLTDKEIAVKIVRELYEALIDEDYAKAGRLYSNIYAQRMREKFADIKIIRIISIEEPVPHPSPGIGGFMVSCKLEIEKDGVISVYEPYGPAVRRVSGQPERWSIHGGITK